MLNEGAHNVLGVALAPGHVREAIATLEGYDWRDVAWSLGVLTAAGVCGRVACAAVARTLPALGSTQEGLDCDARRREPSGSHSLAWPARRPRVRRTDGDASRLDVRSPERGRAHRVDRGTRVAGPARRRRRRGGGRPSIRRILRGQPARTVRLYASACDPERGVVCRGGRHGRCGVHVFREGAASGHRAIGFGRPGGRRPRFRGAAIAHGDPGGDPDRPHPTDPRRRRRHRGGGVGQGRGDHAHVRRREDMGLAPPRRSDPVLSREAFSELDAHRGEPARHGGASSRLFDSYRGHST